MKKTILTLVMAVSTISIVYGGETSQHNNDNTTNAPVEMTEAEAQPNNASQVVTTTAPATQAAEAAQPIAPAEEESNATMYILLGAAAGVVSYAVYRKMRKDKRNAQTTSGRFVFDERNTRVIRHKELTLDYLLNNDVNECKANGAVEMNLFRVETFTSTTPNVEIQIADIDEHNSLMCVGVNEAGEMVYYTLHCAQSLDESIAAAINSENILKVKF